MTGTPADATERWLCDVMGARRASAGERIQSLWSGYGEIRRFQLSYGPVPTVIVKDVRPPGGGSGARAHPRGWDGDISHARKLRSYAVESAWYRSWAARCDERCRIPACFATEVEESGWRFALEDLDAAGFPGRRGALDADEKDACLRWLAELHATFMGEAESAAEELWPVGSYWHLDTRPDEFAAMPAGRLREAAAAIDARLNGATYKTLVHGDAKVANFCFPPRDTREPRDVAVVDFQYIGGGCGVRDVAYFLSCLSERSLEEEAEALLDSYFRHLRRALERRKPSLDGASIEREWRALYPFAWADFERFLAGWAPGHGKLTGYSARLTAAALASL